MLVSRNMAERPAKRVKRTSTPDLKLPPQTIHSTSPDPNAGLLDERDLPIDRHAHREVSSTPELEAIPAGRQRVSIYLQAFEEMLNVVLEHERYLFSEAELEALDNWQKLSCACAFLTSTRPVADLIAQMRHAMSSCDYSCARRVLFKLYACLLTGS